MSTLEDDVKKARAAGEAIVRAIGKLHQYFNGEYGPPSAPDFLEELTEYAWYGLGDPAVMYEERMMEIQTYLDFVEKTIVLPVDELLPGDVRPLVETIIRAASARVAIDNGSDMKIEDLAALARVTDRTIRSATSSNNPNAIPIVKEGHWTRINGANAFAWLKRRRDFVPTAITTDAPNLRQLYTASTPSEPWKIWREASGLEIDSVATQLQWTGRTKALYADFEKEIYSASTLELDHVFWFDLAALFNAEDADDIAYETYDALVQSIFKNSWTRLQTRQKTKSDE